MRVYFSGIGGVGIGPLAQIAKGAGASVVGSDQQSSLTTDALIAEGITVNIGSQNGDFLRDQHQQSPFDYFVYTAALPDDHPELMAARQLGIVCLKRDGLLARIIENKDLEMIAISGTHGKTSTTALLVWVFRQLKIPVSYSVGSTLSFAPSGEYDMESGYFVYECDEYDRNMLHYTPVLSLITSIDYDHPDTYPTVEDYQMAFGAFLDQSANSILWQRDYQSLGKPGISTDYDLLDENSLDLSHLHLPGQHMRQNAFLVERAVMRLFPEVPYRDLIAAINSFPGTNRRMERLAENLYSDYGHHPREIAATLQLARELSDDVVLVYQPHQNVRQHKIRDQYTNCMTLASEIYWLPTYLSREDDQLEVLTPQQLTANLTNKSALKYADLDDDLWQSIREARQTGKLVLCMGAGSIDAWLRQQLNR